MNNEERKPQKYDLVLGGNNPPSVNSLVLGGIEGVKNRLASDNIQYQIKALSDALNYSDDGLDLVIDALSHYKREVRQNAYRLLKTRKEEKAKKAVSKCKFWSDFEYLNGLPYQHAQIFAHRIVEVYNPNVGIINPSNTAYFLAESGYYYGEENSKTMKKKFKQFWSDSNITKVEALVIGYHQSNHWYSNLQPSIVELLFNANKWLTNLKALFLGDIENREMRISDIRQKDISPILAVYPQLEILHIRGGRNLQFSQLKHDKLKAIRIESSNLPARAINQLCALDLPALEYLELWMGNREYSGKSTIDDLMPIITGEAFPHLKYLGLRNANYTDEIVLELVKSPLMENLIELDLSLGTLCVEGLETLLNCPAVNNLDTLNLAHNYLWQRDDRILELTNQLLALDCTVIIGEQKPYSTRINMPISCDPRCCSVRE